jgi:hypothetical protein
MMTSRDTIFRLGRRAILSVVMALPVLLALPAMAQTGPADPLPSRNDTATKKAIVTFVERYFRSEAGDRQAGEYSSRLVLARITQG